MSYIDRDALGIGYADRNLFNEPAYADGWNSAIKLLKDAPSADVAPIIHGEWVQIDKYDKESNVYCSSRNMRLIDADAFERYMQDEWENNRLCNEAWITFRETLKACPTINAMQWISSKEMLPDRDQVVVGIRKRPQRPPDASGDVWDAWFCVYDDRYGWLDIEDRIIEGITHWMPLSTWTKEDEYEKTDIL